MNFVEAVKIAKSTASSIYKRGTDPENCVFVQRDHLFIKRQIETFPWTPTASDIVDEWDITPIVISISESDRATLEINQTAHGGQQIVIQRPAEITIRWIAE